MTWRTFVAAHWPALVAADFFTTEVWTTRGLVTYYTAFVIELHSRRVQVLGSTPYPDEALIMQTLRQVTGDGTGIVRDDRPSANPTDGRPCSLAATNGRDSFALLPVSA